MNNILTGATLFEALRPDVVTAVSNKLHPVCFPPHMTVFAEGEPGDRLYVIESGMVKISRRCPRGSEYLLAILGQGEMFGETAVFDPGPRMMSAITATTVHGFWIDRPAIRGWIAECPGVGEHLLQVLTRRLRWTNDAVADVLLPDVRCRVAKRLLVLGRQIGSSGSDAGRVIRNVTEEDIAQLACVSPEAVHRVLLDFVDRGWIQLDADDIVLLHSEHLARKARGATSSR